MLLVSGCQQKQTTRQSLLALYVDILGDASHARPAVCFNVHGADAWRCHVYISRGLPSCKFRDGRFRLIRRDVKIKANHVRMVHVSGVSNATVSDLRLAAAVVAPVLEESRAEQGVHR